VHSASAPLRQSRFELPDEAATARLGACLGGAIQAEAGTIERSGLVLTLSGELGAGKTCLVRAALRRLGIEGTVRSPSFSLLELYAVSRLNFYHFDFYRFSEPEEFESLGFRDFFGPGSVCAVEWPERAGEVPLPVDLRLRLEEVESGRLAGIDAMTPLGAQCLDRINQAWQGPRGGAS